MTVTSFTFTNKKLNRKQYNKDARKMRYEKNKEYNKEYRKLHYRKNIELSRETVRINTQKWRENNREHVLIKGKEYYNNNKKYRKLYMKEWRENNPERIKEYNRILYSKHKNWGYEPINKYFKGANFHHMHIDDDRSIGIFIPVNLHRSIYHRHDNQESMDKINKAVLNWLHSGENNTRIETNNNYTLQMETFLYNSSTY